MRAQNRATRGAVNRLIAILLVLVAIMLALVSVPIWNFFRQRSERLACAQAMKSAGDGLIIDYLFNPGDRTADEARASIDEIMPARPDICPAGGTVYLIKDEHGVYQPVCGLHDRDEKQRTRLNGTYALELLNNQLRWNRREQDDEPLTVDIQINGKTLSCQRVQEEWLLARGTRRSKDYDGVIALYGLNGEGNFKARSVEENEICYFVYADENYSAVWHADTGWSGTSYA